MKYKEKDDGAEVLHRHHRELYRLRMDRKTPEEAEFRRARRGEHCATNKHKCQNIWC